MAGLLEILRKGEAGRDVHKIEEGGAQDFFERRGQHFGESRVRIKDAPAGVEGDGAFAHGFDEQAVGVVGALEGEDLRAFRALDDECIDGAGADGLERLAGFREAQPEFADGISLSHRRCYWSRSRPSSTRSVLERSPMNLRMGSGCSLTSVGKATTWSLLSRSGC